MEKKTMDFFHITFMYCTYVRDKEKKDAEENSEPAAADKEPI